MTVKTSFAAACAGERLLVRPLALAAAKNRL